MICECLTFIFFPLLLLQINEEEASLFDMLWLLLASVIFVPIFQKIPGGTYNNSITVFLPLRPANLVQKEKDVSMLSSLVLISMLSSLIFDIIN